MLDEFLQHLRDMLGIKSMSQLDSEDNRSAYLKQQAAGQRVNLPAAESLRSPFNAGHPVTRSGRDVYFDPVQMQPQEGNTGESYPGPNGPMPLVHRPDVQMQSAEQMGPPSSMRNLAPQEILEGLASAESRGGRPMPRYEPGQHLGEDVYFANKGQMMSPQEAQDYLDFLGPQPDDTDLPPAALAAMRRR